MAKNPDREDPRATELLMRRFFPHTTTRQTVVAVWADAVVEANSLSRVKWGTTIRTEFIRLNLGRVQVVTIGRELLHLLVVEARLPAPLPAHLVLAPGHASVPSACGVQLSAPTSDDWRSLRPAWREAARLAAETPIHNMTKPYHATGVVEFLRMATGRDMPAPAWAE